jgi:DNA-binding transcriptional MerR regulator
MRKVQDKDDFRIPFLPSGEVLAMKKKNTIIRTSIITIISASLISCGASQKEYQNFATAGKEYASALDLLLVSSGNYFVDANSEILLREDSQEPGKDGKNYRRVTEKDEEWLKLIGQMRQHASLLKRYFLALESLATSNAPEQAKQTTERIFSQLNSVSNSIQGSRLVSPELGSALSPIPQIILSQKIRGALRDELEQRKEAIYRELALESLVLKLLTIQMKNNLKIIQDNKENRAILEPYVAPKPIENPNAWVLERRDIRTMTLSIEALNNYTQASEEFKEAFKLILSDKFTMARANALLSDIESLLKVAEDLKKATNSP